MKRQPVRISHRFAGRYAYPDLGCRDQLLRQAGVPNADAGSISHMIAGRLGGPAAHKKPVVIRIYVSAESGRRGYFDLNPKTGTIANNQVN